MIIHQEFEVIDETREHRESSNKIENVLKASRYLMNKETHGNLNMPTGYRKETNLSPGMRLLIHPRYARDCVQVVLNWNRSRNWFTGCNGSAFTIEIGNPATGATAHIREPG